MTIPAYKPPFNGYKTAPGQSTPCRIFLHRPSAVQIRCILHPLDMAGKRILLRRSNKHTESGSRSKQGLHIGIDHTSSFVDPPLRSLPITLEGLYYIMRDNNNRAAVCFTVTPLFSVLYRVLCVRRGKIPPLPLGARFTLYSLCPAVCRVSHRVPLRTTQAQ